MNEEIIKAWFEKRFNRKPEQDKAYFEEWVDRFKTGHPESFMDSKSLEVWKEFKINKELKLFIRELKKGVPLMCGNELYHEDIINFINNLEKKFKDDK